MKPSELKQFERSTCACGKCKAGCKSMPGRLASGDLDAIANFFGVDPGNEEFTQRNFRSLDDWKVGEEPVTIPTIVPAQKESGRCVFLTKDDRCSIHPVAPFGCRNFDACGENEVDDVYKSICQLAVITHSRDYLMTWGHLHTLGIQAPPIGLRKAAMHAELDRLR
ncbi:YkgJ family cysteine cluster protein [Thalassoroseus pseudoceratinae]|uniref:YkgJ family cysteine cluster protein n=1 Tax=Thalassoroseus pseudoceratinae TaxID=2713176 RepID=UPI0021BCE74A|nr:YkgJ family cysteine cluster protein [Thalassoroseus pseudoceratinae]